MIYGDLDRMMGMNSEVLNPVQTNPEYAANDFPAATATPTGDPQPINSSDQPMTHIGQQGAGGNAQVDPNAPTDWGENIESELDFFLAQKDEIDPLYDQIQAAKKKAQDFMHIVKSKFPNRYFILKRLTQNMEHWQTCCQERNYVIITDESYAKKLQNCYEVTILIFTKIKLLFEEYLTTTHTHHFPYSPRTSTHPNIRSKSTKTLNSLSKTKRD